MTADAATLAGEAAFAEDLARRAGRLLAEAAEPAGAQGGLGRAATRKSSRTDLATAADRASERLIVDALRVGHPDDAILGEEGGELVGRSGRTWVVDPLDGTTNFVYAYPAWAVSIALVDESGPLLGVVHDPTHDETFCATRGGGATLNGRPLAARRAPALAEALVGTGFSYDAEARAAQGRLVARVAGAVRDLRRSGAASLDLCYVAAGRLDAYYEAHLKPWDSAAGLLVAREAGARSAEVRGLGVPEETLVVAADGLLEPLLALLREAAAS
ncbi:MAG TPA: inositol monophosphatase family protein [Acidimicrobiales bacterium]|nr:inositol monophosphatase family protein [Acidimicrobiales bacterium]